MSYGPVIPAPPRGGPARYGLLESVGTTGFGDPHERMGARFLSEPCLTPEEWLLELCPDSVVPKGMDVGFGDETEAVTFGYVASFGCSRAGMSQAAVEARARKVLADGLGYAVESRWYTHLALTPEILSPEPVSPACGLSLVVEALGGVGAGTGVIYAGSAVASTWSTLRALTVEDGRLRELLGSLVVATRAPAATPVGEPVPDAGVRWLFASDGIPQIRLGPVNLLTGRDSILDSTNDYEARAEQEGWIAADACLVAAVPVLVCDAALREGRCCTSPMPT